MKIVAGNEKNQGSNSNDNDKKPHPVRPSRQLVTAQEVADLLQVSRMRVYELARTGVLPGIVRLGRQMRFDLARVIEWVDNGGSTANPESQHRDGQ